MGLPILLTILVPPYLDFKMGFKGTVCYDLHKKLFLPVSVSFNRRKDKCISAATGAAAPGPAP